MENQTEFDSTPLSKLHSWIFFKPRTITLLIVIIFLAIGIKFRWEALDCIRLVDWITRDYDRAFHLFDGNYIPLAGPETTGGGRLPGPFLYFFLSIPLVVNYSYESIFFFNFILSCIALILFFFIVKRYFGFYLSAVATIFFSINLLQIESIAYPINPSFIHIFAVTFFWLLMEFVVNKNHKVIPWIFLIITLAIQIHFSIATYYLVVILVAIILKIKIPLKYYLISSAIILICLTPYFVYKNLIYQGVSEPSSRFFVDKSFSIINILKIISNYDSISRVALRNYVNQLPFFISPKIYNFVHFYLLSLGFYSISIFVLFKIYKKQFHKVHRETAILLLFYIPGLIFGILSPTSKHYWYTYIFHPCEMVLYAYPIKLFYNLKKNRFTQFGLISISILIISYFTFFTYKNYLNLKFHSNYLKTGNFINYYPYKELVKIFLEEISLSAHEFNENIFFEGFSGYSKKLVKLFKRTNNSLNNDFRSKENRSCLFIIFKDDFTKQIAKWFKNKMMPSNGLTIFLSDKSLMIGPYKILRFGSGSSAMDFILFKYRSKYNQPCYENSSNQYSVAPKIISLLKELKKSDFQKNSNPILQLDKKITFNSDSELIKFGGDYLIIDPYIKTPIKISFAIVKENQRYKLKGAVNLYEFTYLTSKNKFNISRITFKIFDKNNQSYQDKKFYNFNLIEKSSLIGKMSLSNMTNRLFWRKEMSLPEFKFFFGKTFGVDLEIEAYFPNRKDKFYTNKFNLY